MQDQPFALVELTGVFKSYGQGAGRVEVLRGVELSLQAGQTLCIVGHSGSGKSTLLNIVGGLDWPDKGGVFVAGRSVSELSEPDLAGFRNEQVGFVFQLHHLLPQLTVLENVLVPTLPRRLNAAGREKATQRAMELLEHVGLSERKDFFPAQLSGGERQRSAVVRALINQPPLLLADEPTGALDEPSAWELADLLAKTQREQGLTLVVVTHWMELARKLGNVRVLHQGRLEAGGA
jgi:ABC-type lipoprotein export system ATPase subunit